MQNSPGKSRSSLTRKGWLSRLFALEWGRPFCQFVRRLEEPGETEHDEVFIDGTKRESKANRCTFVWRQTVEKREDCENNLFVMGNGRNSYADLCLR